MNSTGVFVVYKIPPKIENEDPLPTLKITCMTKFYHIEPTIAVFK